MQGGKDRRRRISVRLASRPRPPSSAAPHTTQTPLGRDAVLVSGAGAACSAASPSLSGAAAQQPRFGELRAGGHLDATCAAPGS